jgi:hypothetical protein
VLEIGAVVVSIIKPVVESLIGSVLVTGAVVVIGAVDVSIIKLVVESVIGENLAYTSSSKAPNLNDCSGFLIYFVTGDVFLSFLLRLLNIIVLF